MSVNGKFSIPPELSDAIQFSMDDNSARLRVALPGKIDKYDPTKRTAEIVLGYNRVYNDGTVKKMSAPLVDVPVFTLQGGGVHIGMPIKKGDECLVIFSDINIDAWHAYGGQQTPLDKRRHDIADGFAFVGPNSLANPLISPLLPTQGGISGKFARVAVNSLTEKVQIANATQSLLVTLTALLTTLTTLNTAIAAEPLIPGAAAAATTANATIVLIQAQLVALLE